MSNSQYTLYVLCVVLVSTILIWSARHEYTGTSHGSSSWSSGSGSSGGFGGGGHK